MFSTYVLWSAVLRKRYVGSTSDLALRLDQHNAGLSTFTKRGIPWILLHAEDFPTRREAEERERKLKSGQGRAWLDQQFPQCGRAGVADLSAGGGVCTCPPESDAQHIILRLPPEADHLLRDIPGSVPG